MTAKKIHNINEFIVSATEIHGDKYSYPLTNIYQNTYTKIEIICDIHGSFLQRPDHHLSGSGCQKCGLIKNTISRTKKLNQFIYEANIVHNNRYDYSKSVYINANTSLEIICPIHGSFLQKATYHTGGMGCNICKLSKGEFIIKNILDKYNIKYVQQKKFDECKNKRPLPFDFYLPDRNICIEYDGIQHFEPIKYWGGIPKLNKTQAFDKIRNNFCYKQGIKLIRIPYWEKDNSLIILSNVLF